MPIVARNYKSPAMEDLRALINGGILQSGKDMGQAVNQGAQAGNEEQQIKLKGLLQGEETKQKGEVEQQGKEADLRRTIAANAGAYGKLPEGTEVSSGSAKISPLGSFLKGPGQASHFQGVVEKEYKPIEDQVNAARSTLDLLNQGNSTSDNLAWINEAKLANGGNSRALKSMVDVLTHGKTAAMDMQSAINYINNTSDIPTLQPAQRNAIRESVYGRLDQIGSQHKQSQQKMMTNGAQEAPYSNYGSIVDSYASPVGEKLKDLYKMRDDYKSSMQNMNQPIDPRAAIANPAPSTLDKIKSVFNQGNSSAAAPASPNNSPQQSPLDAELQKRGMLNQ